LKPLFLKRWHEDETFIDLMVKREYLHQLPADHVTSCSYSMACLTTDLYNKG